MIDSNRTSASEVNPQELRAPRVVIVGGGFGGLAAAKALRNASTVNILIDRTNHHLFQPLLYQVATAVLAPGQISSPIRGILREQKNTTVIMGEVTGVDKEKRCVFVNSPDREHVPVPYDYLILATGVRHSYFKQNEFERYFPRASGLTVRSDRSLSPARTDKESND
jgi:NADH dehydrogenase FAD-containing subunit